MNKQSVFSENAGYPTMKEYDFAIEQELTRDRQSQSLLSTEENIVQTKQWTIEDVQGVVEDRQKQLESNPLLIPNPVTIECKQSSVY